MTKKDRLGSDPLSFVKDTRDETPNNTIEQVQKEKAVSNVLTKSEPDKTAAPLEGAPEEIVELSNLKIIINKLNSNNISISFVGEMTIYNIEEIRNCIVKYFNKYNEIDIEMSRITQMDTSGFQLILAVKKQAENNGKIVKLLNPSDEVKRIFSLYDEDL